MLHELAFVGVFFKILVTELAYSIVGNRKCGSGGQ